MPLPIDQRKRPAGVKVHVTTGEGVEITWSDGHASRYDFPYLRDHCPCATCNDERLKKDQQVAQHGSNSILPMYKPKVKARSATAVGNYAIQIDFSDGHTTGIFSFDHLREICPCEACGREFRSTAVKETTA
jgi:DUF971 family protein